jgi:hypothetical protein
MFQVTQHLDDIIELYILIMTQSSTVYEILLDDE